MADLEAFEAKVAADKKQAEAAERRYQPRGAAEDLLYSRDSELLLSGPAGTGKSRGCLEKLFLCARKYAGMRGLIVRKTRESLTETALVTFEEKVVPSGQIGIGDSLRRTRQSYKLSNGSVVVVGGMDKASKVMSAEYDMIYVQEGTELLEGDWESLTTRLRNGVMPYQQIIADCNPDTPKHWLKLRCDAGKTRMMESRHEDNPILWDRKKAEWTPAGKSYLAVLDDLSGPRKDRLRFGRWVQAEGVVYESWDARRNLVDRKDIPESWARYLSIDFGFTNPFVCQWWAEDPDGRLWLYREIYRTRLLVEDAARIIRPYFDAEPHPRAIICDHDAEDRATLERHLGKPTVPAIKEKDAGIQAAQGRIRVAGDNKPRLFVMRDTLLERDAALSESKKPTCLVEEIDGYVWDTGAGRKKGDEPIKKDDHAMDAMRYMCRYLEDAPQPFEIRMSGSHAAWGKGGIPDGVFEREDGDPWARSNYEGVDGGDGEDVVDLDRI